jgi:hypothetical protein
MTEGQEYRLDFFAKVLLFVWVVLLLPWVVLAPWSGMAFAGSNTSSTWILVISTWSYGLAVFAAFKSLGRARKAVLLPFFRIAAMFLPDFLTWLF